MPEKQFEKETQPIKPENIESGKKKGKILGDPVVEI